MSSVSDQDKTVVTAANRHATTQQRRPYAELFASPLKSREATEHHGEYAACESDSLVSLGSNENIQSHQGHLFVPQKHQRPRTCHRLLTLKVWPPERRGVERGWGSYTLVLIVSLLFQMSAGKQGG